MYIFAIDGKYIAFMEGIVLKAGDEAYAALNAINKFQRGFVIMRGQLVYMANFGVEGHIGFVVDFFVSNVHLKFFPSRSLSIFIRQGYYRNDYLSKHMQFQSFCKKTAIF